MGHGEEHRDGGVSRPAVPPAPYAHQALRQWRDGDWLGALTTSGKAIFTTQWDTLGLGGLWNMTVDEKVRAAWNRGDYLTAIGRGLTNAAMAVDPGTWFTKLGPISKAARAADKATRLAKGGGAAKQASKAASKAQRAAKRGDYAGAQKAAAQARRKADAAKRDAKKHGCKTGSLANLPPPLHTGGRYTAPLSPPDDPCSAASQAEQYAQQARKANVQAALNVGRDDTQAVRHRLAHSGQTRAEHQNVAVAGYDIDGLEPGRLEGVSGTKKYSGTASNPEDTKFDPTSKDGGIHRPTDSERKILETLSRKLKKDSKGTVELYTEREPCKACRNVIKQFKKEYPGVEIEVQYE